MSWAKTFQLTTNGTVLGVIAEPEIWFIREDNELVAYNPDENRWMWRLQMSVDTLQMDKTLLHSGDLLLATLHSGQGGERAWLFAVEAETGHMVWSRRVAAQSLQGNGHIVNENNWHFLFTETKNNKANLLLLDKSTGELIKSLPLQDIPKGNICTDQHYYYHSYNGSLHRLNLETGDDSIILSEKITGLVLNYDQLFCISGNALFAIDIDSSRITGKISVAGKNARKMISIDCRDQVLVFFEGQRAAVALYDFRKNGALWETVVPGRSWALWTGHEVIIKDQLCKRNISIDAQSGETSPIQTDSFAKLAYFSGGKWFDYSYHTLAVYEWVDMEIQEIDLPDPDDSDTEEMNIADFIPGFFGHEDEQKDRLLRLLQQVSESDRFEVLYEELAKCFHIPVLHDKVKAYLRATCNQEYIPGPLGIDGAKRSISQFGSYKKLFGFGPESKLFPALQVGTGRSNVFIMSLESGNIISGHQEVLFSEYATEEWELSGRDLTTFNQQMEEKYSCFDIEQLMAFQCSFDYYKDDYNIPLEEFYHQAAHTLARSYQHLLLTLYSEPMEFLTGYMDESETDAMIKGLMNRS